MPLPPALARRPLLTLRAVEHILNHVAAARVLEAVRQPHGTPNRWRRALTVGWLASAARHGGTVR